MYLRGTSIALTVQALMLCFGFPGTSLAYSTPPPLQQQSVSQSEFMQFTGSFTVQGNTISIRGTVAGSEASGISRQTPIDFTFIDNLSTSQLGNTPPMEFRGTVVMNGNTVTIKGTGTEQTQSGEVITTPIDITTSM